MCPPNTSLGACRSIWWKSWINPPVPRKIKNWSSKSRSFCGTSWTNPIVWIFEWYIGSYWMKHFYIFIYFLCLQYRYTYLKGVIKKHIFWWKLTFLRYSTSESGMIVEFFSCRPYIEILFSRPTIRFPVFGSPENSGKFLGNFSEISRKFPENFPTPTHHPSPIPTHTPSHPPLIPSTPPEL